MGVAPGDGASFEDRLAAVLTPAVGEGLLDPARAVLAVRAVTLFEADAGPEVAQAVMGRLLRAERDIYAIADAVADVWQKPGVAGVFVLILVSPARYARVGKCGGVAVLYGEKIVGGVEFDRPGVTRSDAEEVLRVADLLERSWHRIRATL